MSTRGHRLRRQDQAKRELAGPDCFLAVDPGTHLCGWAAFGVEPGEELSAYGVVLGAPGKSPLERMTNIREGLMLRLDFFMPGTLVVEAPAGHIAPSLATLVVELAALARRRRLRFQTYYPATVTAAVALRGTTGWPAKRRLRAGVEAVYPGRFGEDVDQDAIDAVAVGLCHLSHLREARIIEERRI